MREASVHSVSARAYRVPTDAPEADGTEEWNETTIVVATAEAGGMQGIGYTYADAVAARLVNAKLAEIADGHDAMDPPAAWRAMQRAVRNLGRAGLCATAIAAVDTALWDLKARLLGVPLASLLGCYRRAIPIYGSGGFTSYDDARLAEQLGGWVERDGCAWVKMKIGADPDRDAGRVRAAKQAIGSAALFVDANGALSVKQAQHLAAVFAAEADVRWFEEPVSSDDLEGLGRVRAAAPPTMEVAAGEYGYEPDYFRRMLAAGAVDVQQADATRCGGVTGFLQVASLCEAFHTDLSAHCAPALHCHLGCAPRFRHLEWFHDHVRIEQMLFDGAPRAGRRRDRARLAASRLRPGVQAAGCGAVWSRNMTTRNTAAVAISGVALLGYGAMAATRAVPKRPAALAVAPKPGLVLDRQASLRAAQRLNRAAGVLAASVLADSAVEHYRGSFANKAMFTPLVTASISLAVSAHGNADGRRRPHRVRDAAYLLAGLTGVVGTGFHIYNIAKKPDGFSWQNLFYSAPLGAPAALSLSGAMGFLAERVRATQPGESPSILGLPAGRVVAAVTGAGLLGTVAEAGLLHFRGAFNNPAMYAPIAIPPVTAALLGSAALGRTGRRRPALRWWLRVTAALGYVGAAFHIRGVARQMGGWRNWSQNVLNGPPIPAPPSFTGLALAGLAALGLMEDHPDD